MVYDYVLAEVFVSDCGGDVTVISGSNDTVVETIPASPNNLPLGIAYDPARGEVFVAWNYSGTISVIADTGGVVDTIPSVHEFADLFNEEELDMAYDSDQGEMIFAIADGGPSVLVINDTSNAVPGRIPLASSPGAQVFDTGTDELFVIDGNQVDAISGSTDHLVATVPVGLDPVGLAYDSGLGEIFVTNSVSNNVSVISDRTDSVVDWIGVGIEPTGVTYDPANGRVFVVNSNYTSQFVQVPGSVSIISDTTDAVTATVPLGEYFYDPQAAVYDGERGEVFIGSQGLIEVLNATTGRINGWVNHTTAVGAPSGLAYDPVNSVVVTANAIWDNVSVVDDATYVVTASVPSGTSPVAITYDTDAGDMFVADQGCIARGCVPGNVTIISATTDTPVGTLAVGAYPSGIGVDTTSGQVFVSNTDQGTLSILSYSLPPPNYTVTLTEQGLPPRTNWSGSVGGVTESSATATLTFAEPNGTYLFKPGLVAGWSTGTSGRTVVVNGGPVNQTIAWSQVVYQVLFNQTGLPVLSLPSGGQFSVTLNGTEEGVNGGDVVVFSEPNGSYPFVVTPPSGWSVSPASGTVLVHGAGEVQTLNFSEVIPPLAVNFTYPYLWTCGEPINVTFTSNVTGASPADSYLWNLGDGSPPSNQADPTHEYAYSSFGTAVTLTVTDAAGTMAIHSETLYVHIGNWYDPLHPSPERECLVEFGSPGRPRDRDRGGHRGLSGRPPLRPPKEPVVTRIARDSGQLPFVSPGLPVRPRPGKGPRQRWTR